MTKGKKQAGILPTAKEPPPEATESRIQQNIVRHVWNSYCLSHHAPRSIVFSIPNEGNPLLVQIGARPGAADLLFLYRTKDEFTNVSTIRIIFLEVKRPDKKSIQKKKQKEFQAHVEAMGIEYYIVRSVEDAKAAIERTNQFQSKPKLL